MTTSPDAAPLPYEGPAAPPRSNGELVFAQPWESRAFGMAVTLHGQGSFEWEVFQSALIRRIAAWEAAHPDGVGWSYYEQWLGALEDVLVADGSVTPAEVDTRSEELAARPAGYDHEQSSTGHGHGHGH